MSDRSETNWVYTGLSGGFFNLKFQWIFGQKVHSRLSRTCKTLIWQNKVFLKRSLSVWAFLSDWAWIPLATKNQERSCSMLNIGGTRWTAAEGHFFKILLFCNRIRWLMPSLLLFARHKTANWSTNKPTVRDAAVHNYIEWCLLPLQIIASIASVSGVCQYLAWQIGNNERKSGESIRQSRKRMLCVRKRIKANRNKTGFA